MNVLLLANGDFRCASPSVLRVQLDSAVATLTTNDEIIEWRQRIANDTLDEHPKTNVRYAASNERPFIWVSGGGAIVVNNRHLLLTRRDSGAPTNPNRLTIQTGRSETTDEHRSPHHLSREFFEELRAEYRGHRIPFRLTTAPPTSQAIHLAPRRFCCDRVVIDGVATDGLLHFNPRYHEINVIQVYDCTLTDLPNWTFISPEDAINREVYWFDLHHPDQQTTQLTPHALRVVRILIPTSGL